LTYSSGADVIILSWLLLTGVTITVANNPELLWDCAFWRASDRRDRGVKV